MTYLMNRGQDCEHRELQTGNQQKPGRIRRVMVGSSVCTLLAVTARNPVRVVGWGSRRRKGSGLHGGQRSAVSDETTPSGVSRRRDARAEANVLLPQRPLAECFSARVQGGWANGDVCRKAGQLQLTVCALASAWGSGARLAGCTYVCRVGLGDMRCSVAGTPRRARSVRGCEAQSRRAAWMVPRWCCSRRGEVQTQSQAQRFEAGQGG